jgi:beta-lactamase class A
MMIHSRRNFLTAAAAAAAAPLATSVAEARENATSCDDLVRCFEELPGDKSLKIYAPAVDGKEQILVESNSGKMLFVASAIKTFVLGEALRQADSPDVVGKIEHTSLELNDTVWSFGSPTFDPPNLSGIVSERTALEAMITRSDNTATDMIFKLAGADNVRSFIASAGLKNTLVPDSTRALTAYVFGADNYLTITWDELNDLVKKAKKPDHPFLNDVETLASSADDFVSYYSRALQGDFFKHDETLDEFRRILTLCEYIYLIPLPLGMSVYAKSGNADFPEFHARSIAGGLYVGGRWAYFAFVINWYAAKQDDPETVKAFFSIINQALAYVRESLSRP